MYLGLGLNSSANLIVFSFVSKKFRSDLFNNVKEVFRRVRESLEVTSGSGTDADIGVGDGQSDDCKKNLVGLKMTELNATNSNWTE